MRHESLRDESVSQAAPQAGSNGDRRFAQRCVMGRLLASPLFLSVCLLGHFECVIDFDAQISYGALEARMAQQ